MLRIVVNRQYFHLLFKIGCSESLFAHVWLVWLPSVTKRISQASFVKARTSLVASNKHSDQSTMDGLPLTTENLLSLQFDLGLAVPISRNSKLMRSFDDESTCSSANAHLIAANQFVQASENRNCKHHGGQRPKNYGEILNALKKARNDETSDNEAVDIVNAITQAPNELYLSGVVLSEIVKSRVYMGSKSPFQIIPGGAWSGARPLKALHSTEFTVAAPAPALIMGMNADTVQKAGRRLTEALGPILNPVQCAPKILCPFFTGETKCYQSGALAVLENIHNAAVMTRNLRKVHDAAGNKVAVDFDDEAHVITLVFSKGGSELSCGWSHVDEDGHVEYRTVKLAGWSASINADEVKQMVSWTRKAIDWAGAANRLRVEAVIAKIWMKIEAGEEVLGEVRECKSSRSCEGDA